MRRLMYSSLLVLLLAAEGRGTTIVLPTDSQLVDKSPVVLVGRVASTATEGDGNALRTRTRVAVHDVLKGRVSSASIDVVSPGGERADWRTVVPGAPSWRDAEAVLLFLHPTPAGDYQVVDLFVGKFSEARLASGERVWTRGTGTGAHLIGNQTSLSSLRHAARFIGWLSGRVNGRQPSEEYLVDGLIRDAEPDFTLLDDPVVYRWKAFDRNLTVAWRSYGSQGTYADGGRQALRSGVSSWTSYAAANIRYRYDGTGSGKPGGLGRANGINEVLFEDPLEEIPGSWDANQGGVLGVGGFNAVAAGGAWTPPFSAGGTHGSDTVPNTWEILESNLVIQDGVASAKGIPESELAEILAHEFGHTLGLGHSNDSTALMYYQVTGMGPSLRADDQLAVRWLYPRSSGGGEISPPQAPAGLSGRGDGPSSIRLDWADRSANETSFIIYMAVDQGPFSRVGVTPANQISYTVAALSTGIRYRFVVTAANAAGESAPSNAVEVTIEPAQPRASFKVTPATGVAALTEFRFLDTSTGPVSAREWQFGDGTVSTSSNPAHTYVLPGEYEVSLTVRSGSGASSVARRWIRVSSPLEPPTASFSFSPAQPSLIDEIELMDESTGMVQSWAWSFGDGTTSSEQNPRKRYMNGGSYSITLTVTGQGVVSTATRKVVVSAGSGGGQTVQADFVMHAGVVVEGRAIRFADASTGGANSWFWDFGDGFISTERAPTHTFRSPGTYTLLFRAGNEVSSTSVSRTVRVHPSESTEILVVPAVADVPGAAGASWRSELTLFNPAPAAIDVTLSFLPTSGPRTVREIVLAAHQTMRWSNAVRDLFGLSGSGGAVLIESSGEGFRPRLAVGSRTFARRGDSTFGQGVPAVSPTGRVLRLLGLRDDERFRTNIGLVNTAASERPVTVRIFDSTGTTVATIERMLAPDSFHQEPLRSWLEGHEADPPLSLSVETPEEGVAAYASVVDNISQDPVFVNASEEASGTATMLLPVAVSAPGAAGTRWLTDLTVQQSTGSEPGVRLRLLALGQGAEEERVIELPAGGSTVLPDIIGTLFGREGAGALIVEQDGAITSRIYTVDASGGSFGQGVPSLPLSSAAREIVLTGLRQDASYRTNLGIVNPGHEHATIGLRFLTAGGEIMGEAEVALSPRSLMQWSVAHLAPGLAYNGTFTVVGDSDQPVVSYVSVIDNVSGDPIFIRPR